MALEGGNPRGEIGIAGTDAHGKNSGSVLGGTIVRLAPLYDVASALVTPEWNCTSGSSRCGISGLHRSTSAGELAAICFLNVRNGPEVDIIVEQRTTGAIAGVEVKSSMTPRVDHACHSIRCLPANSAREMH